MDLKKHLLNKETMMMMNLRLDHISRRDVYCIFMGGVGHYVYRRAVWLAVSGSVLEVSGVRACLQRAL